MAGKSAAVIVTTRKKVGAGARLLVISVFKVLLSLNSKRNIDQN